MAVRYVVEDNSWRGEVNVPSSSIYKYVIN